MVYRVLQGPSWNDCGTFRREVLSSHPACEVPFMPSFLLAIFITAHVSAVIVRLTVARLWRYSVRKQAWPFAVDRRKLQL